MVADFWVVTSEKGACDPKFERSFNEWELEAVQDLLSLLRNRSIHPQLEDKVIWKGSALGGFYVKTFFNILEGFPSCSAPSKILWNPHIPNNIGFFFAWAAWWKEEELKEEEVST